MWNRIKDWKTSVAGGMVSALLMYLCPELMKVVDNPHYFMAALLPALLGVLSKSK